MTDHLPVSASFMFSIDSPADSVASPCVRVNWLKAKEDGSLSLYADAVSLIVGPLLAISGKSINEINEEIETVCNLLTNCANQYLPPLK
jgi:hypothetical protein